MHYLIFVVFLLTSLLQSKLYSETIDSKQEKVLICGVCKDVETKIQHSIENIEKLGNRFKDYAVIVYENNSNDETASILREWAKKNDKVLFISEVVPQKQLPFLRMEMIARARNIVLEKAKLPEYSDHQYLIMADLDFINPWPIEEIVNSVELPIEWDCISANGIRPDKTYVDRFAFRDESYPLGDELLGNPWWYALVDTQLTLVGKEDLMPVYSAFGGLAIYKRATLTQFTYTGTVTRDLENYYKKILTKVPPSNPQIQAYLQLIGMENESEMSKVPICFLYPRCCEHITLHSSMALKGYDKFFLNPKMVMEYAPNEHPVVWW
jgi:hypothetical protein